MQKTFLRSILEGAFWSSGGSAVLKILGFIAALAVVAKLSIFQFGTYQLILAAWALALTFFLTGLNQVLVATGSTYFNNGDVKRARALGLSVAFFRMIVAIPMWLIIFYGNDFLAQWYSGDILNYLKILSFMLFVIPIDNILSYDFSIQKDFLKKNAHSLTEEFFKVAGILLSLFVFDGAIAGLLIAYVVAVYIKVVLFSGYFRPYLSLARSISLTPFFSLLKSAGKWNIAQQYLVQLGENLKLFFIQYFVGREAVALFAIAYKLYSHIASLFPMRDFLIPLIAAEINNKMRLRNLLARGIKYSTILFITIAVGAALVAPAFLGHFFPEYVPSLPIFYILLLYFPFLGTSNILTSFLFSKQEQKVFFYLTAVRYIFMLPFLPLLLSIWGIAGAAVEQVMLYIVVVLGRYYTLTRIYPELRITFKEIVLFDSYDRYLGKKFIQKVIMRFG